VLHAELREYDAAIGELGASLAARAGQHRRDVHAGQCNDRSAPIDEAATLFARAIELRPDLSEATSIWGSRGSSAVISARRPQALPAARRSIAGNRGMTRGAAILRPTRRRNFPRKTWPSTP